MCSLAAFAQGLPESPSATLAKTGAAEIKPDYLAEFATPPEPKKPKVVDRNFLIYTALTFGITSLDMELTQRCLGRGTCRELNPTLPESHWGMYAVNTPVNLAVMYLAYRRKAAGKGDWWIAPMIDIGIHGVGVGTNLRFVGK